MIDHYPECPVAKAGGSCCPWMGECVCQCMCDIIGDVLQGALQRVIPWLPHSSDCNIRHFEGVCDCECAPVIRAIKGDSDE